MDRDIQIHNDPVYAPMSNVLIKGQEEDGEWMVYLQASNEMEDLEGETVESDALKKAKDYYLTHGVLSWDHKHKQTNDPGFIIGEPLDVQFTSDHKTLVKGFLYKKNQIAQKLWGNIQSGAKRLGASIGGGVLEKSGSRLRRVIWDETAITHKPVNDNTLGHVQVVPFSEFAKALMAGSGANAADFEGGRALTPESLQGSTVDQLPFMDELEMTDLMTTIMEKVYTGEIRSYNEMLLEVYSRGYPQEASAKIVKYIAHRVPDVVREGR